MNLIPRRASLVAQVAAIVKEGIRQGRWLDHLPGERVLCAQLQVSRPTLRAGLAEIQLEGLIGVAQGSNRRILRRPSKRTARAKLVGLLSPVPLQEAPPFVMIWIDELREHLAEAGCHLEIHSHRRLFAHQSSGALEELMRERVASCWVLFRSTEPMQRWFAGRGIPCVIVGSCHAGVSLASVDVNYRAVCRHAAGRLLTKGHSRMALVIESSGMAGDNESETGFREAFGGKADAALIAHHNGTVEAISAKIDGLLASATPPTAFLVARSTAALTVITHLSRRGLRLGRDAALISRDSDSYLEFVVPTVARYVNDPDLFARKITRSVLQLAAEGVAAHRQLQIMPSFVKGETEGRQGNGARETGNNK
jgi:LacI family transcriptional regulator